MTAWTKDPAARLDYGADWTAWLQAGETITVSTWIVTPADTLTASDESFTGGVTTVWLSGGNVGTNYRVTNQITTSDGRTDDRSLSIYVTPR